MIYNDSDTIAAVITHVYPSAVGVIRMSGEACFHILAKVFRAGKKAKAIHQNIHKNIDKEDVLSHTVKYGFIYDHDEIIDEVLVTFFKAPRSYTSEDTAEISCHGNPIILDRVLLLLVQNGARIAEPGEFTKRAFLNDRIDLTAAEAVMDLISADSLAFIKNSQSLLAGGLHDKINALLHVILDEIAFIEASLDDPENYNYPAHKDDYFANINAVIKSVTKLLDTYDYGCLLKNGMKALFIGLPNSGKSSLFNALLEEERSIVTDIAGTTRDIIEKSIHIKDLALHVMDTAGIIESDDPIEQMGVSKVKKLIPQTDVILYVFDMTRDFSQKEQEIIDLIKDKKTIIILNKVDLCNKTSHNDKEIIAKIKSNFPQSAKCIHTSAIENIGIDDLKAMVYDMFKACGENAGNGSDIKEDLALTNSRHFNLLCLVKNTLSEGLKDYHAGVSEDLLVIGLTDAYGYLCELSGIQVSDDVINRVFEKFCMGK